MVDCLLVFFNIFANQLKNIMLDLHCLVVVEQFWKYSEKYDKVSSIKYYRTFEASSHLKTMGKQS